MDSFQKFQMAQILTICPEWIIERAKWRGETNPFGAVDDLQSSMEAA
jgi:hypothetical protein